MLIAQQIDPTPPPQVDPPPGDPSGQLILLVIASLGSVVAAIEGFLNYKGLRKRTQSIAGAAATGLAIAEPFVPALRKAQWDNGLRASLRAYADGDPVLMNRLGQLHLSTDEVADFLGQVAPGLLGVAAAKPPSEAQALILQAAEETANVIYGEPAPEPEPEPEPVDEQAERLARSRARLEELLKQRGS
jgi:hypothetical protein